MRKQGQRLALLLVALLSSGAARACDGEPVYVQDVTDGRRFAIFMTKEQVRKSPPWNDSGMPAMTWMRASDFLIKWAKGKYADYDEVKLYQIQIEGFPCSDLQQHRFYVFQLYLAKKGKEILGGEHFAAVLLDGTVVGPTELKNR